MTVVRNVSILLPKNAVEVIRGETWSPDKPFRITVYQPDPTGEQVKIPLPLTDAVVWFTVKRRIEDTEILIQKVSTDVTQAAITDALGGVFEIYLDVEDTYHLDVGDYWFDVWVHFVAGARLGERFPLVKPSIFRLTSGVTRLAP